MSVEIVFTETDKQTVADRHGDAVADRVEKAISDKNETLQWKSSVEAATQRFYSAIRNGGECFPEMKITAKQTNYRAILAAVPDHDAFAFLCVVKKEDHYQTSKQHAVLEQMYQHPNRIVAEAQNQLTAAQGGW